MARVSVFVVSFLFLSNIALGQVNKNATQNCKNVYNYINSLEGESNRVLVGQNCYHGNQIYDYGYTKLFKDLYDKTGKWASLLSVDYEYEKIYSSNELHKCNLKLIEHWNAGGLVTINWTPIHPNGGNTRVKTAPQDLSTLFNRADWKTRIDVIADALKELQESGVVVLFRPMQEMNNNWFWYASWRTENPADPAPYKTHWINLYNYLTTTKGLNNLLWVYSPNEHYNPGWTKPVDYHFPGVGYVDIVAPTVYKNDLSIPDYSTLKSLGKPMGIAEYGTTYAKANGTIDTREYINKIRSTYPEMKYFVCWHNWTNVSLAIASNEFAGELFNDPWIITRDEVDFEIRAANMVK